MPGVSIAAVTFLYGLVHHSRGGSSHVYLFTCALYPLYSPMLVPILPFVHHYSQGVPGLA